jgi:golgi-specific brefeldin A-resistance guanine nucleotide exchange factor 1
VSAILGGGSKWSAASIDMGGRKVATTTSTSATHSPSIGGPVAVTAGDDDEGSLGGRWGLRGKKGKSLLDNPLMSAFTRLRSELKEVKGMLFLEIELKKRYLELFYETRRLTLV